LAVLVKINPTKFGCRGCGRRLIPFYKFFGVADGRIVVAGWEGQSGRKGGILEMRKKTTHWQNAPLPRPRCIIVIADLADTNLTISECGKIFVRFSIRRPRWPSEEPGSTPLLRDPVPQHGLPRSATPEAIASRSNDRSRVSPSNVMPGPNAMEPRHRRWGGQTAKQSIRALKFGGSFALSIAFWS
jgi:hypothetical protein